MTSLVHLSGDRLVVTSLDISNHFGKQHKDVLEAVRNLDCSPEFGRRNFTPASYNDRQNKPRPMYEITRDGFAFLCMGFTGQQAAVWKERYIKAFNQMEDALKEPAVLQPTGLMSRQLVQLRRLALEHNPLWNHLARYYDARLTQREMCTLLSLSSQTVRKHLKQMAAIGLVDYAPNPKLQMAGRAGLARMKQRQLDLAPEAQS